jgi:biopolymer transport protein TolR
MAIRLEVRRTKLRARRPPMHDINVTPMVDVMLVLLVIFMITAPLLTVGVPVDLPRASAPNLRGSDEPLAITIDARGRLFLMETEIKPEELAPRLIAITRGAPDRRIFVRGDQAIAYGRVMEVMGMISAAGFTRVALVARDQPGPPARRK